MEDILHSGVSVDSVDSQGRSPLMMAARLNLAEAVSVLLQNGADPHAKDYLCRDAYAYAIKYKATKALITLLGKTE